MCFCGKTAQVGTAEILLDDSRVAAEKARAAGLDLQYREYEGAFHVFPVAAIVPEAAEAVGELAEFVRKYAAAAAKA